jgi:hypothetical protein
MRLLDGSRAGSTSARPGFVTAIGACLLCVAAVVASIELIGTAVTIEKAASTVLTQSGLPETGLSSAAAAPGPVAPTPVRRVAAKASRVVPRRQNSLQAAHIPVEPDYTEPASIQAMRPVPEFPAPVEPAESVRDLPGSLSPVVPLPAVANARGSESKDGDTPWGAAANAGISVGRGSQKAAVATAGFFTRFSKSIAGSFK